MKRLARHQVNKGYYAAASSALEPEGTMARGSKNLLRVANGNRAWKGPLIIDGQIGSRALFNTPNNSYAGLGDKVTAGIGSIIGLIGKALGFIGTGPLYITGVSRSVSASTALQFLLYRAGSYSGADTGPYLAGLEPPTAPTVAAHSTNASTVNSGTTSARIAFVRGATGGRSRSSPPSASVVIDAKTIRLTVDAADLTYADSVGADRIAIYLPQWGFGFSGPHYEYIEIPISSLTTVDGVADSYEIEYSSADLIGKDLAPVDDYPPPEAVFAVAIEDVVAVIGAYGDVTSGVTAASPGTAIAISLPVFIESFPPDNLLFLPESPVGVLSRAADGFCFVGCPNSMHALLYTGGQPALSLRTIWPNTGIRAQHNMTLGEGGRLYAITAKRGLVRIGEDGEPETAWARDVADEVSTWDVENTVMGWDNDHQCVVAMHDKTLLAFNVQTGDWSAPLDGFSLINGDICAGVTQNGGLIFASNDGVADIALYRFNEGAGTTWIYMSPPAFSDGISDDIFQVLGFGRFDNLSNVIVAVYRDGQIVSSLDGGTFSPQSTGPQHLPQNQLRINARGYRSHQVAITQASVGGDAGIDLIETLGETFGII